MSLLHAHVAACPGCVPHRDPSSLHSPYVRCIRNVLGELTGLGARRGVLPPVWKHPDTEITKRFRFDSFVANCGPNRRSVWSPGMRSKWLGGAGRGWEDRDMLERRTSRNLKLIIRIAIVSCIAVIALNADPGQTEPASKDAAKDCLSSPGTTAPEGSHWYYRINR